VAERLTELLNDLADRHGTPFFLYDPDRAVEQIARVRKAFGGVPLELVYAVKANPNRELVAALLPAVEGLDVASEGELELALSLGVEAERVSFAGPAKTRAALERAVELGVVVVAESIRELGALAQLSSQGRKARVLLRLNPASRIHAFRAQISGLPSPFGIDEEELGALQDELTTLGSKVELRGIHVHAGSQCTSHKALLLSMETTLALAARTAPKEALRTISFGGGFGVVPDSPLDVEALGAAFAGSYRRFAEASASSPSVVLELGRYLVAEAGLYVARAVSEKTSRGTHFVILDGGSNHLFAATGILGGESRAPINVSRPGAPRVTRTLAGPLCTPIDVLARDVEIAEPIVGDLITFLDAGAYGLSMSPHGFLGHRRPAELVVPGALRA
jgi:diaminopimelate decarboxylase